jgi:hypothetical protein
VAEDVSGAWGCIHEDWKNDFIFCGEVADPQAPSPKLQASSKLPGPPPGTYPILPNWIGHRTQLVTSAQLLKPERLYGVEMTSSAGPVCQSREEASRTHSLVLEDQSATD